MDLYFTVIKGLGELSVMRFMKKIPINGLLVLLFSEAGEYATMNFMVGHFSDSLLSL